MLTRKRSRPSLNRNDEEDELSPSKPPPVSAPLSAVKKRKLNMCDPSNMPMQSKTVGGVLGFAQGREKENVEKDELAADDDEDGGGEEVEMEEGDIWEVPDDEGGEPGKKGKAGGKGTGTPNSTGGTPLSQRKGETGSEQATKWNGSAQVAKDDIWEVSASDPEKDSTVSVRARAKRIVARAIPTSKSAPLSKGDPEEYLIPKRAVGQPRKVIETVAAPSPKRPVGRPRKADILKKAKALSREAIRKRMIEQEQEEAADEELEERQTLTRRRSGRGRNAEAVGEVVDSDQADLAVGVTASGRGRGRPRNDAVEAGKEAPKGILTPTKNRTVKPRKGVVFKGHDDVDLGFKDLPSSTDKSQTVSKRGQKSNEKFLEDVEDLIAQKSAKTRTPTKEVKNAPQSEADPELEESDDEACAICNGLDSKKPNEIIFCDNCDFAVHQKCYNVPVIPKGDWLCRECRPGQDGDMLTLDPDDDTAIDEASNDIPDIEGFEDHLQQMRRLLLDRLTGKKRIKLRGHDEEMRKVYQVIEQTVLAGEGNSMLVIGARGCGKTTLVESTISDLSTDHREKFHVVRLNGFIHTDDKLALKEIWRQLGREMDAENEMTGKANHADTLASLLALLSHPSEISESRADETAKSVIFILDEFDLFTTHPRQTLLYNLFDIAQARKAPIVVLGLTTRINVVEALEKRVKSRFSHRYVHLSLPRNLPAFWEICKEGLLVNTEDLEAEGFHFGIPGQEEFVSFWRSMIDHLYNNDPPFKHHLQSHFYRSKSVPAFFTSCILPIANLSARHLPLTGRKFTSSATSLSAPDSKLHILEGLSELELALLIAAARLDIILDTDTCNFAMAYDEYSSLTSRHKIQTSSSGVTALGASAKVWGRDVALGAWERLAEYDLLVPAGIGEVSARDFGAGGRMWKVDVGLEEITGSVESLSRVMAKWCREI